MIKNLIFDFDGTLVDTSPLILQTMSRTIERMQLPSVSTERCKATIGLRLEDVPATLWPDIPGIGHTFASTYREIFDRLKRPLSVNCDPGVIETLHALQSEDLRMAIASSRSHKSLEEYIELFNLSDCFDMIIGGDDVHHGKPHPEPVLTIINALSWEPSQTLTIGDAPVDIFMGRAAKTLTCAVTYGNSTPDQLQSAQPDFTIPNFPALSSIILSP